MVLWESAPHHLDDVDDDDDDVNAYEDAGWEDSRPPQKLMASYL